MSTTIVFSERVLSTINALPTSERSAISSALTAEFILGRNPDDCLSPLQAILYTMIRSYVKRDMGNA
ncbi:MAG: hypothetical protein NC043_07700 [Muribaculaceae bacterium]|nr:hypothetical protein [Muribaculaceae bacterium]